MTHCIICIAKGGGVARLVGCSLTGELARSALWIHSDLVLCTKFGYGKSCGLCVELRRPRLDQRIYLQDRKSPEVVARLPQAPANSWRAPLPRQGNCYVVLSTRRPYAGHRF